jgi:transcriptional regulator with XRE-family HTH domain
MFSLIISDMVGMDHDFADRLADAMQEAGINGRALAAVVGVQESAVSQWLSRKIKEIKAQHAFAIADALGVEVRWLILGEGPRRTRIPPELLGLSPEQITALTALLRR